MKFHESSEREIDFYREGMTREEYISLLKTISFKYHEFKKGEDVICIAGIFRTEDGTNAYWQFLTDKFPKNYIPKAFIQEYLDFNTQNLKFFDRGECSILHENYFARWLLLYGKKRRGWKVTEKSENGMMTTYLIERGD